MNTHSTTPRTRNAAFQIRRILAVLSLAIALVALPMFSPADAGAYPMSERGAARACSRLGGSVFYNFEESDIMFSYYTMSCMGSSGNVIFDCVGAGDYISCDKSR